jgi:hypothetical protein
MMHKLFSTILGLAVATLIFLQMSPAVGTAMYERTKWVGEYFAVGSSEQLQVDSSGNLSTSGTITVNGVDEYRLRNTLDIGTTTPWSEVSPNATTTLDSFACELSTSSTTAKRLVMAKGVGMQSSTTVLASANVAANAFAFTSATTSLASDSAVIAPNTWLNLSLVGGAGVDSPVGACEAVLRTVL